MLINTYLKVFPCSSHQFLRTRLKYEFISTWRLSISSVGMETQSDWGRKKVS